MYLLMFVVGIVLVIGGLWMVWGGKTIEGLADSSKLVMISLGANNTHYADIGLTNSPNWLTVGGTYKQIAGSMGRIIAVDSTNSAYYGTKYGVTGSAYNYLRLPGSVIQASFDFPMAVGLSPSQTVVYIDNIPANPQTATWVAVQGAEAAKTFNYIATSDGTAIGAGTDNQLWFCKDVHNPKWVNISTGLLAGIAVKNIAYEGSEVAVVDANGVVYFASNIGEFSENIGVIKKLAEGAKAPQVPTPVVIPNWKKLGSRQLKQISIRNHMGVGVGTDGNIYFAAKLNDDVWTPITAPSGGSIWAEIYFPAGLNVISFRPATMALKGGASPCPDGYTLRGTMCYSNCPAGYHENEEDKCIHTPVLHGTIGPVNPLPEYKMPSCPSGFNAMITQKYSCISKIDESITPMNNTGNCPTHFDRLTDLVCMSSCPSGSKETMTDCIPPTVPKASTPVQVTKYSCPTGTLLNGNNKCSTPCPEGYLFNTTGTECQPNPNNKIYRDTIPFNMGTNKAYHTLPANTDTQTIDIGGASARYVRIRPPATGGDGVINFSQIMVMDGNGTNIAKGKNIYATSTSSAAQPASLLVDGSTVPRSASTVINKHGTATLGPVTLQTLGTNRSYPSSVNLGSPVPVSGLGEAQTKALATPGCTGFSMTSGSSPTAQLMTITASTPSTPIPPKIKYTAPSGGVTFTNVGTNLAYPISVNLGLPIQVTGLADAQAKALATPGCSGFSIITGSPLMAQLMTITANTPSIVITKYTQSPSAYYKTFPPPAKRCVYPALPIQTVAGGRITIDPSWDNLTSVDHPRQGDIPPFEGIPGNHADLKKACLATPGCNTISHVPSRNVGYLKNIPPITGTLQPSNGVNTHRLKYPEQMACLSTDPNWTFLAGSDYPSDKNLLTVTVPNVEEAKAKCLSTPRCNTFTFGNNFAQLKAIPLGRSQSGSSNTSVFTLNSAVRKASPEAEAQSLGGDLTWKVISNQEHITSVDITSSTGSIDQAKAQCLSIPGCTEFVNYWGVNYFKRVPLGTERLKGLSGGTTYRLVDSVLKAGVPITETLNTVYTLTDRNWTVIPDQHKNGQGDISSAAGNIEQGKAQCLAIAGCTEFVNYNGINYFKNIPIGTGTLTPLSGGTTYRLVDSILRAGEPITETVNTVYTVTDPNWVITPEQHHDKQGDIGSFTGTVEAAKAKCLATPGCTEFAYGWGTAYLKSMLFNSTGFSPMNGITTYALIPPIKQEMEKNTVTTSPGVWASASGNRDTEFVEVDLGSNMVVASVRLIGRNDYNYTTHSVDRMTGLQVQLFGSSMVVLPYSINSPGYGYQRVTTDDTIKNVRYVRVRPPSKTGTTGRGYDGIISLTQVAVSSDTKTYGTFSFGKPVFVTSTYPGAAAGSRIVNLDVKQWNGGGNFAAPSTWPNIWASATTNTEAEFADIDLGKGNTKPVKSVLISGQTGLTIDRMTGTRVELLYEAKVIPVNGCPVGYTNITYSTSVNFVSTEHKVCYAVCPTNYIYDGISDGRAGYVIREDRVGKAMCRPNGPSLPTTVTEAVYTPPCPPGATQVESLCYSPCPTGSTDAGSTTCQPANTKRKQGPAPTRVSYTYCTKPLVYSESTNKCMPGACPTGTEVGLTPDGKVFCMKPAIQRTQVPAVLSYACNADEILQNGVCLSKCPDGTAPDGELCVSNMKVVPVPADAEISCTSSPYKGSKKWMCDSPSDYSSLITNPTNTTTYVSPTDEVCVTDDPTTKMYYCVTGAEAKAGKDPIDSIGSDFAVTCATITKRYTDLSNNLTNLIKIQNGLRGGSTSLGSASTSLANIYNQIGCSGASGAKGTLCQQILNASSSVKNNASSVSTTLSIVIPSLQQALDTRTNLLGFKTKFQCPE